MNAQVFLRNNVNQSGRIRKINRNNAINHSIKDEFGELNNYGIRLYINSELCNGCKLCADECLENVLFVSNVMNKKGFYPVTYSRFGCNGCSICVNVCPVEGAIRIFRRVKPG